MKDKVFCQKLLRASSLGVTSVICVIIGFLIGFHLDKLLHTRPIMMLIFTIAGIISGLCVVIKEGIKSSR